MASVELSKLAYSKMLFHAFKYPHTAINGVLLAKEGSTGGTVCYEDAIPLFHQNLSLAPMLEVALMQIECYCRSNGLVIAGYYHASDLVAEMTPDFVSQKISEKIAEHYPNACLVLINNRALSKKLTAPAISVVQYSDGKWKVRENPKILPSNDGALKEVSGYLSEKLYNKLSDFDDHLDDIHNDWLNGSLNEVIDCHA